MTQIQKDKLTLSLSGFINHIGSIAAVGCFIFLWDMNSWKASTSGIDQRQSFDISEMKVDINDCKNVNNEQNIRLEAIMPKNNFEIPKRK